MVLSWGGTIPLSAYGGFVMSLRVIGFLGVSGYALIGSRSCLTADDEKFENEFE